MLLYQSLCLFQKPFFLTLKISISKISGLGLRLWMSLCLSPYKYIFLPSILLELSCDGVGARWGVLWGWLYVRLTAKNVYESEDERGRGERGESALCEVQYNLALWFLSRGHVANFPTDGIHFLYFTFPWTPLLRTNLVWLALSPPLPSSSAWAVIRGEKSPTVTPLRDVMGGGLLVWRNDIFMNQRIWETMPKEVGATLKRNYRHSWRCWKKLSFKWQQNEK